MSTLENFKNVLQAMQKDFASPADLVRVVTTMTTVFKDEFAKLREEQEKIQENFNNRMDKNIQKTQAVMEKKIQESIDKSVRAISEYYDYVKSENKRIREDIDDIKERIPSAYDDEGVLRRLDELEKEPETDEEEDMVIKKMQDDIEELKKRPIGRGGGGTSALGVAHAFKYIAHTERPVGDIDGVNTTYTVKNNIWWIAGFMLSGEPIAELPNFTFSGNTITFTTALPAVYSGKDFEIKYIGT